MTRYMYGIWRDRGTGIDRCGYQGTCALRVVLHQQRLRGHAGEAEDAWPRRGTARDPRARAPFCDCDGRLGRLAVDHFRADGPLSKATSTTAPRTSATLDSTPDTSASLSADGADEQLRVDYSSGHVQSKTHRACSQEQSDPPLAGSRFPGRARGCGGQSAAGRRQAWPDAISAVAARSKSDHPGAGPQASRQQAEAELLADVLASPWSKTLQCQHQTNV